MKEVPWMSEFSMRKDLNQYINANRDKVDNNDWYEPSDLILNYMKQTDGSPIPCYKPTPCRSQIKCCDQCRYRRPPKPTKHVFNDSNEEEIRGTLYLKVFPWTRFQTAYTCRMTDYIREKNLMHGGMEGPVFMRQETKDRFTMYLTKEYPIVDITINEKNVITDIELGEKGNRLNDRAIRELKDFLYFQLIFPHEGEK